MPRTPVSPLVSLFTALALCLALTGCGEAVESALCRDAAKKLCDKQFSCAPTVAAVAYGNVSNCYTLWNSWCDDSDAWTGCDVDNAQLRACRDGIASSSCGQYPPGCTALLSCYQSK